MLVEPRIPQNVGGIGRLCAATRSALHVVRPIPFELSDKSLRRAGMDYLELLEWRDHIAWSACKEALAGRRFWYFTSSGERDLYSIRFEPTDVLVFGSESVGLRDLIPEELAMENAIRIPMAEPRARCLNLAMSAAVAVYEAVRQLRDPGP